MNSDLLIILDRIFERKNIFNNCEEKFWDFILFQRHPTDKAYFIAKEILMTERTYKKDLEVINLVSRFIDINLIYYFWSNYFQWFRDEVSKEDSMPEETLTLLFSHIDPLYELHTSFLKDIEQRMATW